MQPVQSHTFQEQSRPLSPWWSSLPPVLSSSASCLFSFQLLLGSGVGTVRLYDTEAKKNLCEININDDMPR